MNRKWFAFSLLALSLATTSFTKVKAQEAPRPPSEYSYAQNGWDTPPREFREIQQQGYHDGIEGARKDFDNHRRPDVNNREEYRHPMSKPVPVKTIVRAFAGVTKREWTI
jgi:hypothetical protein